MPVGGLPEDTGKVIGGGPMMGKALRNTEVPICKGSSGVLIMNDKEAETRYRQDRVSVAVSVSRACPMGLEPYLLATLSSKQLWDKAMKEDVVSCIECGSCQFTCPSNRPLLDLIRDGKSTVLRIIHEKKAAAREGK